jgi:hypothetical protein
MNTPFDAMPKGGARIVYVRPVATEDLPDEVRDQIGAAKVVYSVNGPDGQRLALVADRTLAFHLARAHDFAPVSVH